jgi:hypothetical protein
MYYCDAAVVIVAFRNGCCPLLPAAAAATASTAVNPLYAAASHLDVSSSYLLDPGKAYDATILRVAAMEGKPFRTARQCLRLNNNG